MPTPTPTRTRTRLLAHITNLLPVTDWHRAEHLADRAERLAATPAVAAIDPDSGLPAHLAAAARTAVRDHTSGYLARLAHDPVPAPDIPADPLMSLLAVHRVVDTRPPLAAAA